METKKITFITALVLFIGLIIYFVAKKNKSKKVNSHEVSDVVLEKVRDIQDSIKKLKPHPTKFPIGEKSAGDNVVRLQKVLDVKETGTFDLDTKKALTKSVDGLNIDTTNVSEALVILLEERAK